MKVERDEEKERKGRREGEKTWSRREVGRYEEKERKGGGKKEGREKRGAGGK